jgi:hypothetical protein
VTTARLIKAEKVKKEMPKGGQAVIENKGSDDVKYPCIVRATYKKAKISTIVTYLVCPSKKKKMSLYSHHRNYPIGCT